MKTIHTTLTWVLLFFLLTGLIADSEEVIYWTNDYQLSWSDFQGEPRFDYQQISALTSSGIMHYKGCKDGKIIYKIISYFEKEHSWVKEEAHTDYHLGHEQIHFDITELYARKLRKLLSEREFKCSEDLEFEQFILAVTNNWETEQKLYDIETEHSLNKEAQEKWEQKIKHELKKYATFASKKVNDTKNSTSE